MKKHQGEGGEQGDALMPVLFAVGQHQALEAAHRQLQNSKCIFAILDDIYIVTSPERVGAVFAIVQSCEFTRASGSTLEKLRCGIGQG